MAHYPTSFSRVITTHDGESGNAIFDKSVPEEISFSGFPVPPGKPPTSVFALAYSTTDFPVSGLSPPASTTVESRANRDVKLYKSSLADPSPLNPTNGTACTVLEVPVGNVVAMHRTSTLDYGVVIDGVTELLLDSGESKVLRKGDVFVQRGTAHSWKNLTNENDNNGVLRVFFVFQPIEKIVSERGELGQDLSLSLR